MSECKLCKSTDVSTFTEKSTFTYKNKELSYDMAYSVCNSCDREFIDKNQIQQNEIGTREAKKKVDGLLSLGELFEMRNKFHLTQEVASKVFGGGPNAFSKYERGLVSQSAAMDRLIRVSDAVPGVLDWLKEYSGMNDTKPTFKLVYSDSFHYQKKVSTDKGQWKTKTNHTEDLYIEQQEQYG